MAEILDVAPLYFTCPSCGTKQSAGIIAGPDFFEIPELERVVTVETRVSVPDEDGDVMIAEDVTRVPQADKRSPEEHRCRSCGTIAIYAPRDLTFEAPEAVGG